MGSNLVSKVLDYIGIGNEAVDIEENEYERTGKEAVTGSFNGGNRKLVSIHSAPNAKVVVARPRGFDDMQDICSSLKHRKIVIVNLRDMDFAVAQRCVDFACGSIFVLDGDIMQVAPGIILLSPNNVDVSSALTYGW